MVKLPPSLTLLTEGVRLYVATLVSLIVTLLLVATTLPLIESVLTYTKKVSAPSVVISAVGVTLNEPVLSVIVKLPLVVAKSPALLPIVQYKVVPLTTFAVVTLNVPLLPSLILVGIVPKAYVGGTLTV